MKKALFILGMTIAIALPTAAQQKIEQIVARVNGDIILKSEMDHELDVRRFTHGASPRAPGRTVPERFASADGDAAIAIELASREGVRSVGAAEEFDGLGWILRIGMTKADPPVSPQDELLAPQRDLRLAGDRQERAVRAVVDEHETIAPSFDVSMHSRC